VLLLVRHSLPEIDWTRPAGEWRLSEEGRVRCERLAIQVGAYGPERLLSSPEPKAFETAELIAPTLGLEVEVEVDLREHQRRTLPFLPRAEFLGQMREFFARPDEVVVGEESAKAARARFAAVVAAIGRPAAVVTHGTVIALYTAGSDPDGGFGFWKTLALPDVVKVS
jgi:2,3-bisphosphoglycerate-dependent phosphoglycerate mutase